MWNEKFNCFLVKLLFSRSEFDSCVYFRRVPKELLIVAIFVDDLPVTTAKATAEIGGQQTVIL
jgi:hypothetical protein